MTAVEPRTIEERARRYVERFLNQRDPRVLTEVLAPDVRFHGPASIVPVHGYDLIVTGMRRAVAAFPDLLYRIEHLAATTTSGSGPAVLVHWSMTGTHTGAEFGDVPATGRRFTVTGVHVFRFDGDRAVEVWDIFNTASMADQLGLVKADTEQAKDDT